MTAPTRRAERVNVLDAARIIMQFEKQKFEMKQSNYKIN
jgi:hypothetical protein